MKKSAVVFSFITLGCLVFFTADAWAQFAAVEGNYRQIRSVSFRMESFVTNSKGNITAKGRILLSGTNKRLDSISPDRMAFVFFNDTYSVYSYQDKKLVTKKYSELSEAHLLFTEEMFWTIVYNPFQVLQERYILPPSSARAVAKSPVSAQSRRDPDATVLISFNDSVITSIEYYYKKRLNKRILFDSPVASNNVKIPSHARVSIFAGDTETMHIDLKISDLEINTAISDTMFTRIAQ